MPFTSNSLRYLRALAKNNNKPWFEEHRDQYEETLREPMRALITDMDARFSRFAPEIGGDPKRSMFRINRDIRFSRDKSPYKTHVACWFFHRGAAHKVGGDAEGGSAGFYFHLQPGQSMIGGGLWMPPRPQLNRIRLSMTDDPVGFGRMVKGLEKRFDGLGDEAKLKRLPRGYDESHPAAKWLRYQSFTSGRRITDAEAVGPKLPALLEREFKQLLPLVRWLNDAMGLPQRKG
jgi:uncharacterized protein (TIGR02453 family)